MNSATEKFVALNKKQAETAFRAFQIGFNAWEMLVKLNLEATKSLLDEGTVFVQSAPLRATEMTDFSAWNVQLRAGAEKVSGYSRNVYEIGTKAAGELGELLEQTLLSNNQEVVEWVEDVIKSSPIPPPEATAAAAKAAMANAKSVIEGISKAVRKTAGYADTSVRAAAAATAEAVKNTAK
jgi:phasin family protein